MKILQCKHNFRQFLASYSHILLSYQEVPVNPGDTAQKLSHIIPQTCASRWVVGPPSFTTLSTGVWFWVVIGAVLISGSRTESVNTPDPCISDSVTVSTAVQEPTV